MQNDNSPSNLPFSHQADSQLLPNKNYFTVFLPVYNNYGQQIHILPWVIGSQWSTISIEQPMEHEGGQ